MVLLSFGLVLGLRKYYLGSSKKFLESGFYPTHPYVIRHDIKDFYLRPTCACIHIKSYLSSWHDSLKANLMSEVSFCSWYFSILDDEWWLMDLWINFVVEVRLLQIIRSLDPTKFSDFFFSIRYFVLMISLDLTK